MADIVKLNVGGVEFHTTRSTLTKYDGYFRTMLESEIPPTLDESGRIFIDRSPKYFHSVLDFLRDGFVSMPDSDFKTEKLLREAEYYMLEGLIHLAGGETSQKFKKENAHNFKFYMRDWRGANKRCEIQFTANRDEFNDFTVYCKDKLAILISYNAKFWDEILINPDVRHLVQKYSRTWNILFFHLSNEFPQYFIRRPGEPPVGMFGPSREPQLQSKEFFEQIERSLEEYSGN